MIDAVEDDPLVDAADMCLIDRMVQSGHSNRKERKQTASLLLS